MIDMKKMLERYKNTLQRLKQKMAYTFCRGGQCYKTHRVYATLINQYGPDDLGGSFQCCAPN